MRVPLQVFTDSDAIGPAGLISVEDRAAPLD